MEIRKIGIGRVFVLLALLSFCTITFASTAYAQGESAGVDVGTKFLGMALAVGLSCLGAGYAVAKTGVAASATVTEKPELFGRTIVYVGMAEGIAIYGLLIAFLIWIS